MKRILYVLICVAGVARGADAPPPDFVPEVAREAADDGNKAFQKGDFKSAAKSYQQVVDLAPGNLVGLVNLGMAQSRLGELEKARVTLHEALKVHLETGAAWLTLGMLYYEQKKYDEAFGALAQAVTFDPGNPRAHNYLGVVMGMRGWLDGAAAELRRAVQIDPEYRDAHYNLAVIYLQQTPPAIELARRHYFRSISLGGTTDAKIEKTLSASAASH